MLPCLAWMGTKTLLAAREKTGKTTLVMAAVAAMTTGRPFLQQDTTPSTVLWMTEEPPSILVKRAKEFGADPDRLYILPMGKSPTAQLKVAVQHLNPGLIVIDTLYRFAMIEDENEAGAWLPTVLMLDEITQGGTAVLLLAHSQKSESGEYRGSTAIGGYVDAILTMGRPKDGETLRRIRGKGRLDLGKPFIVQLAGNTFNLVDEVQEETIQRSDREKQVMQRLQKGITNTASLVSGMRRQDGLKVLETLEQQKIIQRAGRGWRLVEASDDFTTVSDGGTNVNENKQ